MQGNSGDDTSFRLRALKRLRQKNFGLNKETRHTKLAIVGLPDVRGGLCRSSHALPVNVFRSQSPRPSCQLDFATQDGSTYADTVASQSNDQA
jgi:hypothetical protein